MEHNTASNIVKTPFSCARDGLTIRGHIFRAAQTKTAAKSGKCAEAREKSVQTRQTAKGEKSPIIILSHGFLGDESQLVTYAEALANIGYTAITFDFNGGGPESTSSGKSVDMTVLTEKADLLAVINYAESLENTDTNNISLAGVSQGGFVSALVAAELKGKIKKLILFFPALCIPDDARSGNMLVMSFDPNNIPPIICEKPMIIGRNYALTAQKLDAYKEISGYDGKTLIIHGTADKVVNIEYSRKAQNVYKNIIYKEIEGADHGFTGTDDEEAIRTMVDFCNL